MSVALYQPDTRIPARLSITSTARMRAWGTLLTLAGTAIIPPTIHYSKVAWEMSKIVFENRKMSLPYVISRLLSCIVSLETCLLLSVPAHNSSPTTTLSSATCATHRASRPPPLPPSARFPRPLRARSTVHETSATLTGLASRWSLRRSLASSPWVRLSAG